MSCMLLLRLTGVLEAGWLGGPDGPARPAGPTYLLRLEVDMSSWHMQVVVLKRLELRREVVVLKRLELCREMSGTEAFGAPSRGEPTQIQNCFRRP